jgi:hypothetical protein
MKPLAAMLNCPVQDTPNAAGDLDFDAPAESPVL